MKEAQKRESMTILFIFVNSKSCEICPLYLTCLMSGAAMLFVM